MDSREVNMMFLGAVKVTGELYENVMEIFAEKKFEKERILVQLEYKRSTFFNFSKLKLGVSKGKAEFVKRASEYIHRHYKDEYSFTGKIFEKKVANRKQQFNLGIYYGYFTKPFNQRIDHFILSFEQPVTQDDIDGKIKMWSDDKFAIGSLHLSEGSYAITLEETTFAKNKEFFIGKSCDNPNLKFCIATWRNSYHEIFSAVCILKFIPKPPFSKWDEIRNLKATITSHIKENRPTFASSFFNNTQLKHIQFDVTGYEFAE
jgi:hypothetical protein